MPRQKSFDKDVYDYQRAFGIPPEKTRIILVGPFFEYGVPAGTPMTFFHKSLHSLKKEYKRTEKYSTSDAFDLRSWKHHGVLMIRTTNAQDKEVYRRVRYHALYTPHTLIILVGQSNKSLHRFVNDNLAHGNFVFYFHKIANSGMFEVMRSFIRHSWQPKPDGHMFPPFGLRI